MSLDISLYGEEKTVQCECECCGNKHTRKYKECVYDANITHNLGDMAGKAGIYYHLWRPEEIGITKAGELIEPLTEGLKKLKKNPEYYKQFNSPNGWGMYEHFIPFVEGYLDACKEYPESTIIVCR